MIFFFLFRLCFDARLISACKILRDTALALNGVNMDANSEYSFDADGSIM